MNFTKEPILHQDYPDTDVIRVDDTFYMISTTMHFLPGAVILRSYNLMDWEIATYVYDKLDSTDGQKLNDGKGVYGKGMWAASLRYHEGLFYVVFVCNDTGKTYLYRAKDINGPWEKSEIEGFYHDCSLYFEGERVYIIYGNRSVYITELKPDLSGPLENGLNRLIVKDSDEARLGYEGSHFYKIGNLYYLFLIHCPSERWLRTEGCFISDSLTGEFKGGEIFIHENGYRDSGIAQGGIVDDVKGNYYAVLFQDRGASGRIPYVLPCSVDGKNVVISEEGELPYDSRKGYKYAPLFTSDFTDENGLLNYQWQWNHEPELSLVDFCKEDNSLKITTGTVCNDLEQAVNTLTQRVTEYHSSLAVTLNFAGMNDGDEAGISAFMGCYSYISVEKQNGKYYLTVKGKDLNKAGDDVWKCDAPVEENYRIEIMQESVRLKMDFDCKDDDYAEYSYDLNLDDRFNKVKGKHLMAFRLDHFCGCRFGLFYFSKEKTGGNVIFANPEYNVEDNNA